MSDSFESLIHFLVYFFFGVGFTSGLAADFAVGCAAAGFFTSAMIILLSYLKNDNHQALYTTLFHVNSCCLISIIYLPNEAVNEILKLFLGFT